MVDRESEVWGTRARVTPATADRILVGSCAAIWLALRSYVSSAVKHGVSAFEALRLAMTGTPWIPPIALEG